MAEILRLPLAVVALLPLLVSVENAIVVPRIDDSLVAGIALKSSVVHY